MIFNAVIPTIGRSPLLIPLLSRLIADGVNIIWLPDNEITEPTHALFRQLEMHGESIEIKNALSSGKIVAYKTDGAIYDSWNSAMDRSTNTPIAILNDDIILQKGSLAEAFRHLDKNTPLVGLEYLHPNLTPHESGTRVAHGTYKDGGIGGFGFVVNPDKCPRIHPDFTWWYGDDDLVRRIWAQGNRTVVATGAIMDHPNPSTTGNQVPALMEACTADMALFDELWKDSDD